MSATSPETTGGTRTVKILAIDGGGVRGLIPALILAEVEKRCGKPVWQLFDVVAGTSNGAVMTMLLTRPEPHSAAQVVSIYSDHCGEFFRRSLLRRVASLDGWLRPKYPAESIESTLRKYIGEGAELKDALVEVVACAYSLRARWPRVELFSRHAARSRPGCNFKMWEVARASSAAPGYFPGPTITSTDGRRTIHPIDGGVYANDPAVVGLAHAISLETEDALVGGRVNHVLVSVGTGFHDEPILPQHSSNWGLLGWAPRLIDVMFEGQADLATREVAQLLASSRSLRRQWRLQVSLSRAYALDDISAANIAFLKESTARFIADRNPEIEAICKELMVV
jgi:patatin-like phospholipase/acyl hydrolase